ncbi:hypothetical protein [Aeromonas sobria]|uniref:hypothetical protein n=1 Tax=Aeromonas sobria TaxID=646 RepID=UPI000C6D80A7|nr:hypothetical protein [Aeromonas sobria]PKQ78100.1 hypothetical protein CJF47_07410 [Aeromonas sobria]
MNSTNENGELKTFADLMAQQPPKRQLRMTKEQRHEVELAISAGISNKAIAEFFEMTIGRVSQIKKEMRGK